jgi:hypothetical protein
LVFNRAGAVGCTNSMSKLEYTISPPFFYK